MTLFTIFLDYRGATLIMQVRAGDAKMAILEWAKRSSAEYVTELGEPRHELTKAFEDPDPVEVEGLDGVWCDSATVDDDSALLHVVRTDPR